MLSFHSFNPEIAIGMRTETKQLERDWVEESTDIHVNVCRAFLKAKIAKIFCRIP